MKAELKVMAIDEEGIVLSNGYVELLIPLRSKLVRGKKLKEGELYTITLEKPKKKK